MKKHLIEEEKLSNLLAFAEKSTGLITIADASEYTGYSTDDCKQGLLELICRYEGEINVNLQNGSVAIHLVKPLKRRIERKSTEIIYKALKIIISVLLATMKSITALLLLVIIFAFYIMPMLLISIFSGVGKSKGNSFVRNFDIIYELKNLAFAVFSITEKREIKVELGKKGLYYRRLGYIINDSSTKSEIKSFTSIVFDFVFGSKRATYSKRDLESRITKLISKNRGIISPETLSALEGYSLSRAKEQLLEIAIRHEGQLEFDNNGSVFAYFPAFEGSKVQYSTKELLHYYDEIEPPFLLTGNTKDENWIMGFALTLPVIVSISWLFSDIRGSSTTGKYFEYMYFYVIGITAFIILMPLVRYPFVSLANRTLDSANRRRQAFKLIFSRIKSKKEVEFSEILKIAGSEKFALKIISDLEADIITSEVGNQIAYFKNINLI